MAGVIQIDQFPGTSPPGAAVYWVDGAPRISGTAGRRRPATQLLAAGYSRTIYPPGIGRVDFLIEGFLIGEVDGFAFHSSGEALRRDLGRNSASTLGGCALLRYMPEHIWFESERVVAEIRAVLGRRSQPAL